MGPSGSAGGGSGTIPGGRMTHSLSTPSGVDGTPSTAHHRGGKKLAVRIQMLDDSVTLFQVQAKALGRVLFEQVCRQLNLLEADYFGLEYQEPSTHTKYWLDLEKPLNRQVGLSLIDPVLRFCVKFYTPDPAQLEEEYTRYLFCLQIKRDLATGSLQCNDNTAALMASYIVQASCGDYVAEDYPDHTYLSSYRFVPHQDAMMQRRIMENHKKHVGQSPAEADLNLLETARRCELYGMKMHPAKDIEGVPLNLAVAHMGIAVFQGITRINTFSWAKIRKISFKRKRFLVKLHPEGYGYYKDTVEFFFEGRNECKNFWKKCVENHGFFRCTAVQNVPRRKTRVLSRGSSFRYSGKTQKQIIEFVRENYVKRQTFQRSQSFRQGPLHSSSRSQSHTYVNSSISAHPLLPIETAQWDYLNQCTGSTTPSQTKKDQDTLDRQHDNLTDPTRSQVTAAQVETYQMKNYAPESPTSEAQQPQSVVGSDLLTSSRSVSPQAQVTWSSPSHLNSNNNSMRGLDRVRAHQGGHSSGQSLNQLSRSFNSSSPHQVSVGSQAYVHVSPPLSHSSNSKYTQSVGHSVDLSNSMEEEEEDLGVELVSQEEADSDLMGGSSISRESAVRQPQQPQPRATPVHYSSTSYSMSKQCLLNTSTATPSTDDTDNIIYSDINDLCHYKYPNTTRSTQNAQYQTESRFNERDIYATVNRKTKTKAKGKHLSDEFIDESIVQYTMSKRSLNTVPDDLGEGLVSSYFNSTNVYHGINGNVSLDRRGEVVLTPPNRYDLTLGSDKSSSLSRSEAGTYDIIQAEARTRGSQNNINNNNNTSPTSVNGTSTLESNDGEPKKRKWPTEKSYFLAKELLMTERTYKKDLDVLNVSFRQQLSIDDVDNLQPLFHLLDLMIQHHSVFLRDLEHRLVLWEGRGTHESHRIGDVMLRNMAVLPIYDEYIENHRDILQRVNEMFDSDSKFQQIYREFEQQKICYLPVGYLLLKPLHRLLHYQLILERLTEFYSDEHIDRADCQGVLHMLTRTTEIVRSVLPESENFVLLCELQRDINGFDTLVQSGRKLIRQGCLLKHSKRGLQQRMFFLFSDILLYGTKSPVNQTFKILGHVPVRSLLTENAEHNTFTIFGGQSAITVSAGTTAEKTLWLAELSKATADIKSKPPTQLTFGSLKNCSSSEEGLELCGLPSPAAAALTNGSNTGPSTPGGTQPPGNPGASKTPPSRSNTALHVCWHRGATVGLSDHLVAAENQLAGYLLRKFKNSSGWQKLWVVFTSFCLYFYKSYQDDFALASLPLLGYSVGPPGRQDTVQKEFVFKLSFKNHVYYFRAESEHTYNRWLEVLRSTTQTQDFKNMRITS